MEKDLTCIKEDIRALLLSADTGLSINQLQKDYFHFNGFNIPFGRYGYPTFLSFLQSISDVVDIRGHGTCTLLYPVITKETQHIDHLIQKQRKTKKKKPRFQYKELEKKSSHSSEYTVNQIAEHNLWNPPVEKVKTDPPSELNYSIPSLPSPVAESYPGDNYGKGALPDVDSEDEVHFVGYPLDVVRFARDIDFCTHISEAMEPISGFYPVQITYLRTPYKMWFQLNDEEHFRTMDNKLQEFYEALPYDELRFMETDIREKRACAARFQGKWCRGEIVSDVPDEDGDYKVFCLDFGQVVRINPKLIKFLMNDFGKLPRQAYRGRLASVKPKFMRWSRKSTDKLKKILYGKILYAKLENFDQNDNCHTLTLLHTYDEEDINISEYLAAKCSDVIQCDPKGKLSFVLSLPTFQMLEQGLTPMTSEFVD